MTRQEIDELGSAEQGTAEWLYEMGFPVPYAERIARALVELGRSDED